MANELPVYGINVNGNTISTDGENITLNGQPHNHNLSELADVDPTDKADGTAIIWNEALGKHIYGTVATSGTSDGTSLNSWY